MADNPFWAKSRAASGCWRDVLIAAGSDVTWINLPAQGIQGSSHALMADNTSTEIAGLGVDGMAARDVVHR